MLSDSWRGCVDELGKFVPLEERLLEYSGQRWCDEVRGTLAYDADPCCSQRHRFTSTSLVMPSPEWDVLSCYRLKLQLCCMPQNRTVKRLSPQVVNNNLVQSNCRTPICAAYTLDYYYVVSFASASYISLSSRKSFESLALQAAQSTEQQSTCSQRFQSNIASSSLSEFLPYCRVRCDTSFAFVIFTRRYHLKKRLSLSGIMEVI